MMGKGIKVAVASLVLFLLMFCGWWNFFHVPNQELYLTHFRQLDNFGVVEKFVGTLDFQGNQRVYILEITDSTKLGEIRVYGTSMKHAKKRDEEYIKHQLEHLSWTGIHLEYGEISRFSDYGKDIGDFALFGVWLDRKSGGSVGIFGTQP